MTAVVMFWIAAGLMLYIYVGYPLLIRTWAAAAGRPVAKAKTVMSVTFVVAAYNEERGIRAKLENLLTQDYPGGPVHDTGGVGWLDRRYRCRRKGLRGCARTSHACGG